MEELATLVVQAQAGDLTAYGVIVQRCQGMALATAHSRLRDRHLAQDVTQEAFVRAYRDLTDLREPAVSPEARCKTSPDTRARRRLRSMFTPKSIALVPVLKPRGRSSIARSMRR